MDADSSNNVDSQAHYHRGTRPVNENGAGLRRLLFPALIYFS